MVEFWDVKCNISQRDYDAVLRDCHIPSVVQPVRPDKGACIRHPPKGKYVFIPVSLIMPNFACR